MCNYWNNETDFICWKIIGEGKQVYMCCRSGKSVGDTERQAYQLAHSSGEITDKKDWKIEKISYSDYKNRK